MRLQIDAERSLLLVGFHPIPPKEALLKKKVGCPKRIHLNLALRNRLIFNPSLEESLGTMVSADFFTLSRTSLYGLQWSEAISLGPCVW